MRACSTGCKTPLERSTRGKHDRMSRRLLTDRRGVEPEIARELFVPRDGSVGKADCVFPATQRRPNMVYVLRWPRAIMATVMLDATACGLIYDADEIVGTPSSDTELLPN